MGERAGEGVEMRQGLVNFPWILQDQNQFDTEKGVQPKFSYTANVIKCREREREIERTGVEIASSALLLDQTASPLKRALSVSTIERWESFNSVWGNTATIYCSQREDKTAAMSSNPSQCHHFPISH